MEKVIILSYDFKPYISVAALRPESWFHYFKNDGLYPVVVTRQWGTNVNKTLQYIEASESTEEIIEKIDHGTIIRSPYIPTLSNKLLLKTGGTKRSILQRISAIIENTLQFYSCSIGPKKRIYHSARKYLLENNDVKLIIATGDPFVLFYYASELSKEFDIPWIADYRDPWSDDYGLHHKKIQKAWTKKVENRIVKTASAITVVPDFLEILAKQHFEIPILTIPNGYDEGKFENLTDFNEMNTSLLKIGFAGTLVEWDPIEKVIDTIYEVNKNFNGTAVILNIYGSNKNEYLENYLANKPELKEFIYVHPRMSNEKLLVELKKHHCLLLFNYYTIVGTKIYDYIALQRLILFCFTHDKDVESNHAKYFDVIKGVDFPENAQEKIIKATESGILLKNPDDLKEQLANLIVDLQKGIAPKSNAKNYTQFSRKYQTHRLAELIKKTISDY